LVFTKICWYLADQLDTKVFELDILPQLLPLQKDKVANIRIGLASVLSQKLMAKDCFKNNKEVLEAIELLSKDKDKDVSYNAKLQPGNMNKHNRTYMDPSLMNNTNIDATQSENFTTDDNVSTTSDNDTEDIDNSIITGNIPDSSIHTETKLDTENIKNENDNNTSKHELNTESLSETSTPSGTPEKVIQETSPPDVHENSITSNGILETEPVNMIHNSEVNAIITSEVNAIHNSEVNAIITSETSSELPK